MALDRQSIEKRDFPVGRRGYDPDAVDAHLAAVAGEVAELRRVARTRTDTLASSASDQVRAIVEAAETGAADIQQEAEAQAREIRDEASSEARSTRAHATDQAREYVDSVSESADSMLTRLSSMQTELDALMGSLRAGAGRLSSELHALQSELAEIQGVISPHADFEPETGSDDDDVDAPADPMDVADPADGADADESELPDYVDDPTTGAGAGAITDDETEGARLIALNMALDGTPREEAARYLDENFALTDCAGLLDEVYASVES